MSNWFLHPSNSGGGSGSSQSIPRRKTETFGMASIHSKHKRPATYSAVTHPTKQIKTERITHVRKPNPVSIDLTDAEPLSQMSPSERAQTSSVETFNVLQMKQEPQTIDSSSPRASSSSVSKSSFVERSISQNVKNEQLSYAEQSPHLPSSTFSPSSQTASEKSNVSSSLDSVQTVNRTRTLSEVGNMLSLKAEPDDNEFESISKEEISFDNSDQLLDNVTVTSVIPNIAGMGEQEDYQAQTIMKNDGTMFVVDGEQQSVERQHGRLYFQSPLHCIPNKKEGDKEVITSRDSYIAYS